MKKVITASFILICSILLAAAAADISGRWETTIETPQGNINLLYVFEVTGDSLVSGSVESPMGALPFTNGRITGDSLTFDINFQGMTVTHTCKVMGDSIVVKVPGMQGEEMTTILRRQSELK